MARDLHWRQEPQILLAFPTYNDHSHNMVAPYYLVCLVMHFMHAIMSFNDLLLVYLIK